MSFNKFPWTNLHSFNLDWVIETIQNLKTQVEEFISQDFETKTFVTNNRKLSESGNFTGTWFGKTFNTIWTMVLGNTELSQEIIEKLNSNESIEYVVDGGIYGDTTPPTIEFDGGDY